LTHVIASASLSFMTDDYTEATYGDRIAEIYDDQYVASLSADTTIAVSFLKELARDGPALELGIGTGRVAIPFAEAGVQVHGIDSSEAMLTKLKAKPGADQIQVTLGSFAEFSLQTRFQLVYVVFNTFFGLLTQEEQVSCFHSVARHLAPDGAFAMQASCPTSLGSTPTTSAWPPNRSVLTRSHSRRRFTTHSRSALRAPTS
jgi:predicted TPR repeat methyltransferase